jgi:hypothetical protein
MQFSGVAVASLGTEALRKLKKRWDSASLGAKDFKRRLC